MPAGINTAPYLDICGLPILAQALLIYHAQGHTAVSSPTSRAPFTEGHCCLRMPLALVPAPPRVSPCLLPVCPHTGCILHNNANKAGSLAARQHATMASRRANTNLCLAWAGPFQTCWIWHKPLHAA